MENESNRFLTSLLWGALTKQSTRGVRNYGVVISVELCQAVAARLEAYDKTGYSLEDFDKLCREMSDLRMALGLDTFDDLRKIIQDDRLLVMPCAIGAPVFVHEQLCKNNPYTGCKYSRDCTRDPFIKCPLRVAKRAFTLGMSKMLGISCWLTKKEAEDAIPADRRP